MKIHFLDVGKTRYGDCILITHEGLTVLVDGAHPGDERTKPGLPQSIPDQLRLLLGPPPHRLSLLIVTHCHSDHIGCLPALVEKGLLKIDDALVADPDLGFGRVAPDAADAPRVDLAALPPAVRRVVAALREEPAGVNDTDENLEAFLNAADTLASGYDTMLQKLAQAGTKVTRYTGQSLAALQKKYQKLGLEVLGPTEKHLRLCAEAIARFQADAADIALGSAASDGESGAVALYRSLLLSGLSDAEDRPGKGAALNDQSIVFTVKTKTRKALLVGDMQFAKPEITGLAPEMEKLRLRVRDAGPYALVKTAHHTSYNGLDQAVLGEVLAGRPLLVHSGGWEDGGHPDLAALQTLRRNKAKFAGFARTDHNGLITCDLDATKVEVAIAKGELNDFTPNTEDPIRFETPGAAAATSASAATPQPGPTEVTTPSRPARPAVTAESKGRAVPEHAAASESEPSRPAPAPSSPAPAVALVSGAGEGVEVITRISHVATRVTVTISVEPGEGVEATFDGRRSRPEPRPPQNVDPVEVAPGRALPKLLVVTSRRALSSRIGAAEADAVLAAFRNRGCNVLDTLPANQRDETAALALVRAALRQNRPEGVVLLGGYDVVPSVRLDAVDRDLRARLPLSSGDSDDFIVWSDGEYGDIDGDELPELPVSRVPDVGSAQFVRTVLGARPAAARAKAFGIRNRERPFADGIYALCGGTSPLLRSDPTGTNHVRPTAFQASNVYLMLHGSDRDGTRFWGESDTGAYEAMRIQNLPETTPSIVFTGCCWGALIAKQPALHQPANTPVQSRDVKESLALSFLAAGAAAVVGCTGSHYSPTLQPYGYFGGPIHQEFWREIAAGRPPALALFNAKTAFLRGMPHGRTHAIEFAIEMKLFHEFTCLGLGW